MWFILKTVAAILVVSALTASLSGCASASEEFSSDPVLQQAARDACESAKGIPNLGSNFNWKHELTGDFNPAFSDEGTFDWAYLGERTARKTYKFSCTGRFDDRHAFASAVLDHLGQVN